jgi:hypothetical protein
MDLMVLVEEKKSCDHQYQSKYLIVRIDDENNLVLDVRLHAVLDQLFLPVLQVHGRKFHRQNQIENVVVVFERVHFL